MHIVYHGPLLEYDGMEFSFPFKHICVLRNIYRIEILKSRQNSGIRNSGSEEFDEFIHTCTVQFCTMKNIF